MFIQDFITGIYSYSKALRLIKALKLWKFFFIPALIGLLIGTLVIALAYSTSDAIGVKISSYWAFEFGKEFINTASKWIGFFLVLILGLSIYKHLVMALSAPFMAPISETIETHLTEKPINITNTTSEFMQLLARGIKINIRNLFFELLFTLPLIILSFIPVLNFLTTALIFYLQSYYAGFGNMDYTMERYFNYSESISFVKKHRGVAVGNGFLFTLMLFIPIIGIMITLPISTVASTIETLEKLNSDKKQIEA